MKITSIKAYPVSIPFKVPFVVWRGTARTKDHVIVVVETDEGIQGIGEAPPFLYYAAETQEDVVTTVERYITPLLIDENPFNLEKIDHLFHTVVAGHHFSKAAVEMALWDIMGKSLGVPLYQLLGGKFRETVPIVGLLKSDKPAVMAAEAQKYAAAGYRHLKIKIGFGITADIAAVTAVREAVGDEIVIRVDAEESYDLKSAVQMARHLDKLNIELFSQPLPRSHHHDMALLRTMIDTPLLLDECIETPEDVLLAVRLQTGDLVNIKVLKSGGMLNAKRMAAIAATAGKAVLTGSMLEMGPGTLFSAHFAISTAAVTYASELVGTTLLSDDIIQEPVQVENGALILPDKPGIGIDLDWQKLSHYATQQ